MGGVLGTAGRAVVRFGAGRGLALVLLVALIAVRAIDPPVLEALRLRTFDFYQLIKPREKPTQLVPAVRIVDIDEASLAEFGQWPWPRNLLADLVSAITQRGGIAIGFDFIFSEADRLSPHAYAQSLPNLPRALESELSALPSTDAMFADQIRRSRVVLGQSGSTEPPKSPDEEAVQQTPIAQLGGDPKPYLLNFKGLLRNIDALEAAALGRGLLSVQPDQDAIIRRVPLVMTIDDTVQPALTVDLLRVATGQSTFVTKMDEAGMTGVVIGGVEIPTDRNGRLWVYYTPHDKDRYVSAADVLTGRVPVERIANSLVLIGTSSIGLHDIKATPMGENIPGVEIHAQLLETVISGTYLKRPNYAIGAEIVIAAIVSLGVVVLVPMLGALAGLGFGAVMTALVTGGAWYLFSEQRVLIDIVYPSAAGFAVFLTQMFLNYRREEVQRRQIRSAFGQYLAPAMVEQLANDPELLSLGGETRELTLLFSDVRGFTAISETYKSNPEGLTALMNRFLTPLSNAIIEKNGTIDKYMGDAVMAFWNAPLDDADHAINACAAALQMITHVNELNAERKAEADATGKPFLPLNVGIGVNTGEAVVGNMGSDMRFDYSVLGDAVNLASRLEGQSKTYGLPIIVGSTTARSVGDRFALAEIDLIRVKGKAEPEHIFGLFGDAETAASDGFKAMKATNDAMLAAYRDRNWSGARDSLSAIAASTQTFDIEGYLALYRDRISAFEAEAPPPDWDGVYDATTK